MQPAMRARQPDAQRQQGGAIVGAWRPARVQRGRPAAAQRPRAASNPGAITHVAATAPAPGLLSFDRDSVDSMGVALAPPNARPIVLLPGFGNCSDDYETPFGCAEEGLATQLRERGWHVEVMDLQRKHWFNVARSLLTLGVWRGALTTDPGYSWYIQRIADAVLRAQEATGADQVHLLGHSAGGWLGRAFIGGAHGSGVEAGAGDSHAPLRPHPAVSSLTTLGTPHRPARQRGERRGKAPDMTGGALGWVDALWPGAAFADAHGVDYVAVAGRSVRGCSRAVRGRGHSLSGYAHAAYMQVSGEGEVWGDCVVPTACATLDGATNLVLDGVRHSMAAIGSFDARGDRDHLWYGSREVLDAWLYHVAAFDAPPEARMRRRASGAGGAAAVAQPAIVLPAGAAAAAAAAAVEGGA
ncbi:hypothetical protein Rsub_08830 [Raphidocelis subcapitata]|uniref:Uncharacterized protein n=1 Tax=Raphidocelis subcapitata TaxID=307507 RepID=A0A2V0PG31_9CHLO|nr:hypothetical protein Rsub_08830 [Raphidocelis subcapitata]|eukprot:GBF96015.1 hypothetical protein Rsub_08830 [Raphidocelis subcapitata]